MANYISCGEFYELIQLFINATKNKRSTSEFDSESNERKRK
jgi:hypothetical protein